MDHSCYYNSGLIPHLKFLWMLTSPTTLATSLRIGALKVFDWPKWLRLIRIDQIKNHFCLILWCLPNCVTSTWWWLIFPKELTDLSGLPGSSLILTNKGLSQRKSGKISLLQSFFQLDLELPKKMWRSFVFNLTWCCASLESIKLCLSPSSTEKVNYVFALSTTPKKNTFDDFLDI